MKERDHLDSLTMAYADTIRAMTYRIDQGGDKKVEKIKSEIYNLSNQLILHLYSKLDIDPELNKKFIPQGKNGKKV